MTPELAYFLKINVAIALFYAFYRLFFHKDTFFHWRRMALLCFFAISMLYPLLNIQGWIKAHEPMVAMADLYATILSSTGYSYTRNHIRNLKSVKSLRMKRPMPDNTTRWMCFSAK